MTTASPDRLHTLHAALERGNAAPAADRLRQLVEQGLDAIPLPASGRTLERWRALAGVAQHDLSLAKLYEGHTDALAILGELEAASKSPPRATWGVWAAEAPGARVIIAPAVDGRVRLEGEKHWCSGAAHVSHAILTAWFADGRGPQLVRLALAQPGVEVNAQAWQAIGMHESASLDVRLRGAIGDLVGGVGDYLSRPGFWQGGAGIAACWHGGAIALADTLRKATMPDTDAARSPLRLASLGRVDLALCATAALLREAAAWVDRHPRADAMHTALRVRLSAEATATAVLAEVGRALGAAPYCRDRRFARMAADLPVFIRQSHADRDLAALGSRTATTGGEDWQP